MFQVAFRGFRQPIEGYLKNLTLCFIQTLHTFIAQSCGQLGSGGGLAGQDVPRGDFGQGNHHEAALMGARVR